jgi:hypothetical protein
MMVVSLFSASMRIAETAVKAVATTQQLTGMVHAWCLALLLMLL